MPARPRTAAKAAAGVRTVPAPAKKKTAPAKKPTSMFDRLRAQALAQMPDVEPYRLDAVNPPIMIDAPDAAEQQFALLELLNNRGEFRLVDAQRVLKILCGDQFDAVWEAVRREKLRVLAALIQDIGRHFEAQGAVARVSEEDFPGGSAASST